GRRRDPGAWRGGRDGRRDGRSGGPAAALHAGRIRLSARLRPRPRVRHRRPGLRPAADRAQVVGRAAETPRPHPRQAHHQRRPAAPTQGRRWVPVTAPVATGTPLTTDALGTWLVAAVRSWCLAQARDRSYPSYARIRWDYGPDTAGVISGRTPGSGFILTREGSALLEA